MTDLASATPSTLRDLATAFEAFNRQAQTLRESHLRLESEVARLQSELAQKNRQLARKKRLSLLGEMAAGVAHEIRNPLGGIHLYADLLAKKFPAEGPERELVGKILGGIRHLNRIVEDLLLYTRELEPRKAPCRLDQVVEEALSYARPAIDESGATIVRRYPEPPVRVPAEASLLCRVVLNLVQNALAAVAGGTGLVEVEISRSGDSGRIAIRDDGCGIAPEDLDRIFHPFFSRRPGGTGLGLSICHRIVDAHGGSIDVESKPGRGTSVTVEIPGGAP